MYTIGANIYGMTQYYQNLGKQWESQIDDAFRRWQQAGFSSLEFIPVKDETLEKVAEACAAYDMSVDSFYNFGDLYNEEWQKTVENIIAFADTCKRIFNARIVNVNPNPISWTEPLDKNEDQLATQAMALRKLGSELNAMNIRLTYHIHSPEMRNDARELCYTLDNVGHQEMGFCCDTHWLYRGAGNSQTAMDQLIERYYDRIDTIHLRQSRDQKWIPTLQKGDVDYRPFFNRLIRDNFSGSIFIENTIDECENFDEDFFALQQESREWLLHNCA